MEERNNIQLQYPDPITPGAFSGGLMEQMSQSNTLVYKNLTLETLEQTIDEVFTETLRGQRPERYFSLYANTSEANALDNAINTYINNTDVQNGMQVQMDAGPWIRHADWQAESNFRSSDIRTVFGTEACAELDKLEEQCEPKTHTTEEVWFEQMLENIEYDR